MSRPLRPAALLLASLALLSAPLRAAVWQWSAPDGDARAFLWVPDDCQRVRGLVVANHNMVEQGILEHPAMRDTLARLGFAQLWVVPFLDATFDFNTGAGEHFDRVIADLASRSGYDELRSAPVVPLGHSACATFPWNFTAWAPERTLALVSYKGDAPRTTLTGNGRKRIEWGDRDTAGVPALMLMGQYEWWEDRLAPAFAYQVAHPASPVAFLCDAGRGHFDYSDRTIAFLARFIEKAADARLPTDGSGKLIPVDPRAGWRIDRWHPDAPPSAPAAPWADYAGDAATAFWCFDEEMAHATEAIYAEQRGKLPQLLSVTDGEQALEAGNGEPVRPRLLTGEDGVSFRLHRAFLETVPASSSKAALWTGLPAGSPISHADGGGPITLSRIVGPFVQTGEDTFRIRFGRAEYRDDRRARGVWLAAAHPGDARHRAIVQQVEMHAPPRAEGAEQTIDFPSIPDQRLGATSLKLAATSSSGLPVEYFVLEGPAEIEGDTLRFTRVPPRAKLPLKITVVTWQYGRTGASPVRTAERVERSFLLRAE